MFKKILQFLKTWDGFWSVPLLFLLFFGFGYAGQHFFGRGFGFYDPAFWQAGFLAVGIIILFNFGAWGAIYFNWPTLFHFIYKDFNSTFQNLPVWQKVLISLLVYAFYMVAMLVVYRTLA